MTTTMQRRTTTAAAAIVETLIDHSIPYVFGVPGGGTIEIYNTMRQYRGEITPVLTRHEQAASCMADAYGRLTGTPGVLMGQGAFIASNGMFGILEASLSGSPMVVITEASADDFAQFGNYQAGIGEYGGFDLPQILKGATKYTTVAATPKQAVQGVRLAIKHATQGRPGPAAVILHSAAIHGEVDLDAPPRLYPSRNYGLAGPAVASQEAVGRAATALKDARKPVIICGNGVHNSRAYEVVQELAELLQAPVTTTYTGKGSFPEVHELAVGVMGTFGQATANRVVAEADLLLVLGSKLDSMDTCQFNRALIDPDRQQIVQVDIEPRNLGWSLPVDVPLLGDAGAVAKQLVQELRQGRAPTPRAITPYLDAVRVEEQFFESPDEDSEVGPLLPQRVVQELNKHLPEDALIAVDAGNNRLWMTNLFRTRSPQSFLAPGGTGGMGWGLPAAIGAKMAQPHRPCIAVQGDGGAAMTANALATAAQYNLPVVWVVFNDGGLGMVTDMQEGDPIATRFSDTDFVSLARGFGGDGMKVNSPAEMGPALARALQSDVPFVLDVAVASTQPYTRIVSPIATFSEG